MIKTKTDLRNYIKCDSRNYEKPSCSWFRKIKNILITSPINTQHKIWQYIRCLRYSEYHLNNSVLNKGVSVGAVYHLACLVWCFFKLRGLSYRTGFQIAPNTIGKGLTIWHYGYIIVNPAARIGEDCTLYPGVEIGHKGDGTRPPIIGNDCFIGAGAKIIGPITIGNNVTVAPNAVVVKDVPDNAVVGGVPAKIIKYKN